MMLDQAIAAVAPTVDASARAVQTCATRDGLAAIKERSAELVVWQRTVPGGFRPWIDGVAAANLPDFRILVAPDDLRRAVDPLLDASGLEAGAMRDWLVDDIDGLVRVFAEITESTEVDMRLDRIDNDACWKFHRDTVDARLLTTYRGDATEWVPPANGEQAIKEQKAYRGPMARLDDYDVAIFKGRTASAGAGIVHRSPPIVGTGQTRLLLCLNAPSIASPEPWTPA